MPLSGISILTATDVPVRAMEQRITFAEAPSRALMKSVGSAAIPPGNDSENCESRKFKTKWSTGCQFGEIFLAEQQNAERTRAEITATTIQSNRAVPSMTLVDAISAVIVAEVSLDATETVPDDVELCEIELSIDSAPLRVLCEDSMLVSV